MKTRSFLILHFSIFSIVSLVFSQEMTYETQVESGEINGAAFRIEIPNQWNKNIVIYYHGYQVQGSPHNDFDSPSSKKFRDVFLSQEFAFAQSSYQTQGWAIKEGVEDTEALRRYFVMKYGKPQETYIIGHSMGAVITIATVERYPEIYSGAMPMCGPLSPTLDFFEERVFDMLVLFDYFFSDPSRRSSGNSLEIKFNFSGTEEIQNAIQAAPEKAAMFAKRFNIATIKELVGVVSFYEVIFYELQERAGGNPFDNRNTIYSGFDDDVAVNRGVRRYEADPEAQEYARQYNTTTGRTSVKILAVHTTYDALVPSRYINYYDVLAAISSTQDLFAAKFVVANGHCNFTPEQTETAFDQLLAWVKNNERPAPGEILPEGKK